MSRIILVVEGQTEQAVVREVIAPVLANKGVFVTAALVGKPGHKGGIRPFPQVRKDIVRLLRQESNTRIGTFFDLYALPSDWPGMKEAQTSKGLAKALAIEAAMSEEVNAAMGSNFRRERFIPYIQPYEIEALLFADPNCMANAFENAALAAHFASILEQFGNDCEMIDDGPTTAPSKRIQEVYPRYQKGKGLNAHAPLILTDIGIERLRNSCRHFGSWYGTLEAAK
jgi:hypothetical protein